jgi:LemA protein
MGRLMPLNLAAGFAVGLAVFIVVFLAVTTYNAIVALRQRIDKAWANIEVSLNQRHDELPNVVAAVRGVMGYEQSVLEQVTRLRSAWSPDQPIRQQAATSEATSAAVRQLFAVVERYPELQSQENVSALQAEIERLEGIISDRRELYNDSVYRYNARIAQLPAVFLASLFGWTPRPFFKADPADLERPDVHVSTAVP